MADWQRVARRIRVPLGFAFAALYLWLAQPTWRSIAIGGGVAALGLLLRAYASGYVQKATALTTAGPYAYTRNPLYLGSIIIAAGFAVAARSWWIAGVLAAMFVFIYVPTIRFEEDYLRKAFGAEFEVYAARVPRLLPRLRAGPQPEQGGFSRERYLKHREYNALLGSLVVLAALAAKLVWFSR